MPTDTTDLTNGAGYITGITSGDVTTALGYTPVNPTSLATVATSGSYADLTNKPTIPTDTSDLTNGAGYITSSALNGYATETWVGQQGYITGISSSDVTTALGYTPYDSSNPSGYTSNVGTVTSVNNISPDSNGDVTIDLSGKADTDLSNLIATGKDNVLKLAYELDLDNKITVTTTVSSSMRSYTVPQDGVISIFAYGSGTSSSSKTIHAGVFTSSSGSSTDVIEHNVWISTAPATNVGLGVSFSYLKDETCHYIADASGFSSQNHAYVYFIPFKKS